MNTAEKSVINFAYFTANFPGLDFINEIWPGGLGLHLHSKLDDLIARENKGYVTIQCFMEFFLALSFANQELLCQWIEKNYHYSSSHI